MISQKAMEVLKKKKKLKSNGREYFRRKKAAVTDATEVSSNVTMEKVHWI